MGKAVSTLAVSFTAKISAFKKKVADMKGSLVQLRKAAVGIKNVAVKISAKGAKAASRAIKDVSDKAKSVAKATVAISAVGSVVGFAKFSLSLAQALKTARQLDILPKQLRGIRFAAESLDGVGFDVVDDNLKELSLRLAEAATGTGDAAEAMHKLQLDAGIMSKYNLYDQFMIIADALAKVKNNGDALSLADQLGGDAMTQMFNTLRAGSGTIKDYVKEADELGGSFDKAGGQNIDKLSRQFSAMKLRITSIGERITEVTAGPVAEFIERWVQASKKIQLTRDDVGAFADKLFEVVDKVVRTFAAFTDLFHNPKKYDRGPIEDENKRLNEQKSRDFSRGYSKLPGGYSSNPMTNKWQHDLEALEKKLVMEHKNKLSPGDKINQDWKDTKKNFRAKTGEFTDALNKVVGNPTDYKSTADNMGILATNGNKAAVALARISGNQLGENFQSVLSGKMARFFESQRNPDAMTYSQAKSLIHSEVKGLSPGGEFETARNIVDSLKELQLPTSAMSKIAGVLAAQKGESPQVMTESIVKVITNRMPINEGGESTVTQKIATLMRSTMAAQGKDLTKPFVDALKANPETKGIGQEIGKQILAQMKSEFGLREKQLAATKALPQAISNLAMGAVAQ